MLIQKEIINVINASKDGLTKVLNNIIAMRNNGDDISELQFKFITYNAWITILQGYLDDNFDENGNIVPPLTDCLTQDQIALIMSKLIAVFGRGISLVTDDWLLKDYVWDDDGFWRDTATWNDVKPII